jgi:hypothetical protein
MRDECAVDGLERHPAAVVETEPGRARGREERPQQRFVGDQELGPPFTVNAHDISAATRNPVKPSCSAFSIASLNTFIVASAHPFGEEISRGLRELVVGPVEDARMITGLESHRHAQIMIKHLG